MTGKGCTPGQERTADLIRSARRIAAITGAGISTGAGLADFRGTHGIYTTGAYPPDVFDIEVFRRDPSAFYAYARDFAETEERLQPTFAHRFLAGLEADGRLAAVVTQNIDGLHQKAGSGKVIELHGGFACSRCLSCGQGYGYPEVKAKMYAAADGVPRCDGCGGTLKPGVVFFGEPVHGFAEAEAAVAASDLLLVIGTSLTVYPAALLPAGAGGAIVVVNRGAISLPRRDVLVADAEIDDFFRGVAALLKERA